MQADEFLKGNYLNPLLALNSKHARNATAESTPNLYIRKANVKFGIGYPKN